MAVCIPRVFRTDAQPVGRQRQIDDLSGGINYCVSWLCYKATCIGLVLVCDFLSHLLGFHPVLQVWYLCHALLPACLPIFLSISNRWWFPDNSHCCFASVWPRKSCVYEESPCVNLEAINICVRNHHLQPGVCAFL